MIYNLTDHWFPDKIGGSCIYAHKLHRLLSKHVRTETITLIGEKSSCEQGMVVHKVLHKANVLRNRKAIRKLARDIDAIWVVHSPWFFLHLFLALGFKVRNRTVAVYHGPWFREYWESAAARRSIVGRGLLCCCMYTIELFYSFYVKRFIFLSENMYRLTSAYLPIPRSRVHVIPMWSEKVGWDRPRPCRHPLTLSTFRRLEPRMGLQDLIHALNRCDLSGTAQEIAASSAPRLPGFRASVGRPGPFAAPPSIQHYQLIICGDGPYKNELKGLINTLGLEQTVQLPGWVTQEEKFRLIKDSDAVIIPSRSLEGFSLLALEALENGTPVLLTEAVGFYEYVRDVKQDFVKAIDLDRARVEIQEFLFKGEEREGLGRIEAIFTAEAIGASLLSVLMDEK